MENKGKTIERTQYNALVRFAKVMAATGNLRLFAKTLMETPADKWKMYFQISTGKDTKKENKELLCQVINFATLMEILEIGIDEKILKLSLNLSIIETTRKMPPCNPNFEVCISSSASAMELINEELIKDYEIQIKDLWFLWFYQVQLLTYSNGETPKKIPKIFLGENAKLTQENLMANSGKKPILQRIVEWNTNYPGEITDYVAEIWNTFPALQKHMTKFGYKYVK